MVQMALHCSARFKKLKLQQHQGRFPISAFLLFFLSFLFVGLSDEKLRDFVFECVHKSIVSCNLSWSGIIRETFLSSQRRVISH